jgi:transcriptional regulator with XRE-family HTH domain
MSPSYISKLAKNEVVQPSRNFIQVVCDKYNVNEEWLISGSGKKNKSLSYEDEIAEIAKALFDDKENDFRIRLTRSIAKMDTKQLKMVEKYLNALLKEEEDENNGMS